MTLEEAEKVARVAETADGGCSHCVSGMAEELQEAFPEFIWEFHEEEKRYIYHIRVKYVGGNGDEELA